MELFYDPPPEDATDQSGDTGGHNSDNHFQIVNLENCFPMADKRNLKSDRRFKLCCLASWFSCIKIRDHEDVKTTYKANSFDYHMSTSPDLNKN